MLPDLSDPFMRFFWLFFVFYLAMVMLIARGRLK